MHRNVSLTCYHENQTRNVSHCERRYIPSDLSLRMDIDLQIFHIRHVPPFGLKVGRGDTRTEISTFLFSLPIPIHILQPSNRWSTICSRCF